MLKKKLKGIIESYIFLEAAFVLLVVGSSLLGYSLYSAYAGRYEEVKSDNVVQIDNFQWGIQVPQ